MKLDGKELARAAFERRKQNMELKVADRDASNMLLDNAPHVGMMSQLVEAIHKKDYEGAHMHMEAYLQAMADKAQKKHLDSEKPEK